MMRNFYEIILDMQKTNSTSQTFLELLKFQESLNQIGWDQNDNCLCVTDQNQAKRINQFVGSKNV